MEFRTGLIAIGAAAGVAILGCNFTELKDAQSTSAPLPVQGEVLGYNSLRALIFEPDCFSCHGDSGGVNLQTYASAFAAVQLIEKEVIVEQAMPPTGPLSASDQELIQEWIDAGAPENDVILAGPSPSPEPSPSPSISPEPAPSPSASPASVHWADVSSQIFTPYCLQCHSSALAHPSGGVTLDTYADADQWVSEINQEALVDQAMPPTGPLPANLQNLLSEWINEGAPE